MNGRLAGKVVLITGAAGGIGTAIARAVTAESATVVLCDINLEGARRLASELTGEGRSAAAYALDISRPPEIAAVIEEVVKRHQRIDVLVNNAAICPRIPLEEVTEADFDRIVGINLKGTFFVSQAVSPVMSRQGSGRIVNISSVGARTGGVAASSVYAATKAGIIAITKSYARTLAPGVTVNAIAPGVVDTEMMRIPSGAGSGHRRPDSPGAAGRPGRDRLRRRLPGLGTSVLFHRSHPRRQRRLVHVLGSDFPVAGWERRLSNRRSGGQGERLSPLHTFRPLNRIATRKCRRF